MHPTAGPYAAATSSHTTDVGGVVSALPVPVLVVDYTPIRERFDGLEAATIRRLLSDDEDLLFECLKLPRVIAVNQEWVGLYGPSAAGFEGTPPDLTERHFNPRDYPELHESMIEQFIAPFMGVTSIVREHTAPTLFGDVIVRSHWRADEDSAGPRYDRIVIVDLDVTDLRATQLDLQESLKANERLMAAARFENLFRITPTPIIEQDYTRVEEWMAELRRQGVTSLREQLGDDIEALRAVVPLIRIVAANPAAVRAVGLPLDELIGPIDPKIVNEGSQPSWLCQLEAVWNRQPEAHAAFNAATADGDGYDAESVFAAPIIDGEPDFSRAVFTLTDVTPHRDEERRMHEVVHAKNRFLASVSHEIRTPLTAILGFAQLLADQDGLSNDNQLMVDSIVEQTQEVVDLVADLLLAASAEIGQIEVLSTTFDLMDQVTQTLRAGGSYTTDVRVTCRTESHMVVGDPARVRQILRNLLTNAQRYGGPDVAVEISSRNGEVSLDVSDDGPPLPPTEWERIFEPYTRAHEPENQTGSVGIGLAISRQLAELMGGSLVYAREDNRSVFRLHLQAAPPTIGEAL